MVLAACGDPLQRAAEDALHSGNRHFSSARYDHAVEAFASARHDARVAHNLGAAHHHAGAWKQAAEAYRDAADRLNDTTFKANAWHGAGNAHVHEAMDADSLITAHTSTLEKIRIEGDDVAANVERFVLRDSLRRELRRLDHLIDSSLIAGCKAFEQALRLHPGHEDARHDLALAERLIALRPRAQDDGTGDKDQDSPNKELSPRARVIIQQADSLVDAYRFKEALGLLEAGLREDPSLQQRKEYMDKLDLVTKAAQPE